MKSVRESVTTSRFSPAPNSVSPFLGKTYDMVDDSSTNDVVSWGSSSNSFVVWNVPEFGKQLLPKYFKHNNFSSFVRQLNTYGFRKVDPDRWEFANEGFLRGQKRLLEGIVRRKPSHVDSQQQSQVQSLSTGACLEVGKFGIEEEVERLKRDKNVLMQELVRLRQRHQTTENQLQTVGEKVQGMEQRQQQMMSFLAKAMRNPGFLNQLAQQQNESDRHIAGSNKKRRLSREDRDISTGVHVASRPNGQIVKYPPSMNEAAKAMLRQILKMSTSPRREPDLNNPGSRLIGDAPTSNNTLDCGRSSSTVAGVTLSEAAANYGKLNQIPKTNMLQPQCPAVSPDLAPVHGTDVTDHAFDLLGSDVGNGECDMLPFSAVLEGSNALETDLISPENDINGLLDGVSKSPGVNDLFWEQFFATNLAIGDPDEVSSGPVEADFEHLATENESAMKNQHMYHLTHEMGLTSNAQRN